MKPLNWTVLGKCVNRCTAFHTVQDMLDALSTGYVPTLRGLNNSEKYVIRMGYVVWGAPGGKNWTVETAGLV